MSGAGTDPIAKPTTKCTAKAGTKAIAKASTAITDMATETPF